jgi:hypothetical protein
VLPPSSGFYTAGISVYSFILKTGAVNSSETTKNFYQTIRHHMLEDSTRLYTEGSRHGLQLRSNFPQHVTFFPAVKHD